jgi:hypothetical protein
MHGHMNANNASTKNSSTRHSDCLVCKLGSSGLTCILDGHLHRVTYTRSCIDKIDSPDDEHGVARNM